jgi:hypothetical protein
MGRMGVRVKRSSVANAGGELGERLSAVGFEDGEAATVVVVAVAAMEADPGGWLGAAED